MFPKCSTRRKDGKEHRSWSVVESRRVGRSVVQRHVLYLGEINDSQRAAWQKSIEVFDEAQGQSRQCALFPEDRAPAPDDAGAVQVRLSQLQLSRPRTWGACWLGDQLWRDLHLDTFFAPRLGCSREGTDWEKVLRMLTLYRLLSPGSEWRLHRHWFGTTTLRDMLALIQKRHGSAQRIWVMDRGIPTEAVLEELRQNDAKVSYLVGTPKGRLTKLEKELAERPWQQVRPQLRVKLLPQEGEVYVLAESGARTDKERAMRRRKLRALWQRLHELQRQDLTRDQRLEKLGAARDRAGRAVAALVQTTVDSEGQLTHTLDRARLRTVRRREGRYLLRTNLSADNPELLWRCYMQLVFVEEAFRTFKGDLGLRPIYHHKAQRIEAHLFVAFLAYCLSITLRQRLKALAGGLMPRVVLEKLAGLATPGRARAHHRRPGAAAGAPQRTRARRRALAGPVETDPPPATAPTHQTLQSALNVMPM